MLQNQIKQYREEKGLTVYRASLRLGISGRRFQKLENLSHQELMSTISYTEMLKFSKLFDVSLDQLFFINEFENEQLFLQYDV